MKRLLAKRAIDERLLIAYLITVTIGLVIIYSASSMMAESRFGSHFYFIRQQFIWVLLGLAAIWFIGRLDLERLAIYSVPALFTSILLLSAVFLMPTRNDAHRWIFLGPFTLQPSEIFKFVMIVYLAFSLSNPKRDLN
ncbi:MAG: FtsW/RodA/SpoVE family cell cycle protein, partial [Candidatus Zixiibacteriota bacterium]